VLRCPSLPRFTSLARLLVGDNGRKAPRFDRAERGRSRVTAWLAVGDDSRPYVTSAQESSRRSAPPRLRYGRGPSLESEAARRDHAPLPASPRQRQCSKAAFIRRFVLNSSHFALAPLHPPHRGRGKGAVSLREGRFPGASSREIKGSAHLTTIDAPRATLNVVRSYLSRVERA
jgi:hypothetical protein